MDQVLMLVVIIVLGAIAVRASPSIQGKNSTPFLGTMGIFALLATAGLAFILAHDVMLALGGSTHLDDMNFVRFLLTVFTVASCLLAMVRLEYFDLSSRRQLPQ